MVRKILLIGVVLGLLVGLAVLPAQAQAPTQDEVKDTIAKGVAWLAAQQSPDGYWPHWDACAVTALAVKKLEHHAVDPKYGLGLPSPFDDSYAYKGNVEKGLAWLFGNCAQTMPISMQPAGDPDSDRDGIGVVWSLGGLASYASGIALMTICEAVDLDRVVQTGPLAGWTYKDVAQDTMDYLAFGQNDGGWERGGWGYTHNYVGWSDNSNTGYVTLGLGYAEAYWPAGCGFAVPQFVKDELNIWIDYIQNDVDHVPPSGDDGGSGYMDPNDWVNILKTGNLLQQMAFVGDGDTATRVTDALNYMARHWKDPNQDPGWSGGPGPASYQGTFTAMKGFTAFGLYDTFEGEGKVIPWQADFETELVAEQIIPDPDVNQGYWEGCMWGDRILCTTWALLTLQKAAPPPPTVPGWMTGGGSILEEIAGPGKGKKPQVNRYTHGFRLECVLGEGPNNLQYNDHAKNGVFHATDITAVRCWDDPALLPEPPAAPLDSMKVAGIGRWNGEPGYVFEAYITDDGEPARGVHDLFAITITAPDGSIVSSVKGPLNVGNHQAHGR